MQLRKVWLSIEVIGILDHVHKKKNMEQNSAVDVLCKCTIWGYVMCIGPWENPQVYHEANLAANVFSSGYF